MIVYLALIIPIIITLGFYVYYRHKITWWEFFIPFGVTLILIISAKLTINAVSSRYTEYIGSSIIEIYEEEPYNE
jgi:ABC-type transport system involved in cytochrome bd biosynthesis fused ATPase/permease subunit